MSGTSVESRRIAGRPTRAQDSGPIERAIQRIAVDNLDDSRSQLTLRHHSAGLRENEEILVLERGRHDELGTRNSFYQRLFAELHE